MSLRGGVLSLRKGEASRFDHVHPTGDANVVEAARFDELSQFTGVQGTAGGRPFGG
jgi:hypothetical protein